MGPVPVGPEGPDLLAHDCQIILTSMLWSFHFYPEEGCSMLLWKAGNHLQDYNPVDHSLNSKI